MSKSSQERAPIGHRRSISTQERERCRVVRQFPVIFYQLSQLFPRPFLSLSSRSLSPLKVLRLALEFFQRVYQEEQHGNQEREEEIQTHSLQQLPPVLFLLPSFSFISLSLFPLPLRPFLLRLAVLHNLACFKRDDGSCRGSAEGERQR
jgi:hypothetical protein